MCYNRFCGYKDVQHAVLSTDGIGLAFAIIAFITLNRGSYIAFTTVLTLELLLNWLGIIKKLAILLSFPFDSKNHH